jgi:predicted RND superfamily exporter protein
VYSLTQFGLMAAIGISFAFLLTFSLLPACLALKPPKARRHQYSAAWQEVLGRLADLGSQRRRLVLALAGILALIGAAGVPKLRVELGLHDLWGPDHPISRALSVVSDNLQRPDRLEIDLELAPDAQLEDPAVIHTIDGIQRALADLDGLEEPRSVVDLLVHAQEKLQPAGPSSSLPNSETALGELLTLISSGDSTALDSWVTLDHRHVRISLEAQKLSLPEKRKLLAEAEAFLGASVPPSWRHSMTGALVLSFRHGSEFGRSQTTIVSASTLLVFLLIGLYLRSLPWAVLAMIPNAVALLLLFGAMGHWGIQMNFGSAVVAPIAIGIAADDTIHFLTAYSRERRSGSPAIHALRAAISSVGEAVIATAIALSLGFLSMMTSPFPSISNIGLLGAIAIIGATLADLLVLPALISSVAEWRRFQGLPGRHE